MPVFYSVQIFFYFLVLCLSAEIKAQSNWELRYGEAGITEKAISVKQMSNGDIFVLGHTISGPLGGTDITFSKISEAGILLWTQYLGTADNDNCTYLLLNESDLSFIISGDVTDTMGNTDGLLMKVDTSGTVIWQQHTLPSPLLESLDFVDHSPDGGYISCGFQTNSEGVGNNCLLAKFDSEGNIIWQQIYGGNHNDVAYMVRSTNDGGYVFTGDTQSFNDNNNVDVYVVKTNNDGDLLWERAIGDEWANGIKSIMQASDDHYFLTGETIIDSTGLFNLWMAKVNNEGTVLYEKQWGVPQSTEAGFAAIEQDNGNFLITGYSNNHRPGDPIQVVLLKVDSDANVLGVDYFGGSGIDLGYDIIPSNNGRYLIAALSNSNVGDGQHFVFQVEEPVTTTAISDASNGIEEQQYLLIYPNPVSELLHLSLTDMQFFYLQQVSGSNDLAGKLSIFDVKGQLVHQKFITLSSSSLSISLPSLPTANYIVNFSVVDKEAQTIFNVSKQIIIH